MILLIFFLVLPKMNQVSGARDDLAAAEARDLAPWSRSWLALEQAELNAPEYKATIREVEEQIPPTFDQSGYLLLIKNAAAQSSVTAHHPDARHVRRSTP